MGPANAQERQAVSEEEVFKAASEALGLRDRKIADLEREVAELRAKTIEECARVAETLLYAADEAFLEKRGDEERVPYEVSQMTVKELVARIRALKGKP